MEEMSINEDMNYTDLEAELKKQKRICLNYWITFSFWIVVCLISIVIFYLESRIDYWMIYMVIIFCVGGIATFIANIVPICAYIYVNMRRNSKCLVGTIIIKVFIVINILYSVVELILLLFPHMS